MNVIRFQNRVYRSACLTVLLTASFPLLGQPTTQPQPLPEAIASLGKQISQITKAHQALYLGVKTPKTAAKMPAILWRFGDPMTAGGDLTKRFEPAKRLGVRRDAAILETLVKNVNALLPKAKALASESAAAAQSARRLAARLLAAKAEKKAFNRPAPTNTPGASEPEMLYAAAMAALSGETPDVDLAAFYLKELAGRLEHLADLDRWLALNVKWLAETNAWTKQEGMAPRSLCFSISSRFNEAAFIQSRVEDILFALDIERATWTQLATQQKKNAAQPASAPSQAAWLAQADKRIAMLRQKVLDADRQFSDLGHQRKMREAVGVIIKSFLPVAAELEYLQRERALRRWTANRSGQTGFPDVNAEGLSLTSRAALACIAASLDSKEIQRLTPLLKEMLGRDYLASCVDLYLYQAAVSETEKDLAARLRRWLHLTPRPTIPGFMDMLHAAPGVLAISHRGDNAYQPQILKWAAQCTGTRKERFEKARQCTHAFYRRHGYNQNQPAGSMRDVLENGLVDCIAASSIFAAVAANSGVAGITPVRYWSQGSGHSVVGLQDGENIIVMDPLTAGGATRYPGAFPGRTTVEIGAPSFGGYVVSDVQITSPPKRLRRDIPYLKPPAESK